MAFKHAPVALDTRHMRPKGNPKMTAATTHLASAAREVLARAEYMLTELRDDPQGIEWEAKLSASLALLRSVGHVLDKADGQREQCLRQPINSWWRKIKAGKANRNPQIFWGFIDEERNLILKYGELRTGESTMVAIVGVQMTALVGGQSPAPSPSPQQSPSATHSYRMIGGSSFAGRDPRDLIEEAIKWWRSELDTIEKNAKASSQTCGP